MRLSALFEEFCHFLRVEKGATPATIATPDSVAIPTAKRILGPQQYREEFREAAVGRPSALWSSLVPAPGSEPLQRDV